MKKIIIFILFFFSFILVTNAEDLSLHAKSAILVEESTGKVIYENNADEQLHPASMTKIMSLILVMDALKNNKISLNDEVVISKESSSMGGSQVYVNEGEVYKVEELLKGVAIASANDAVVALAEKVAGSKEKFVELMNNKSNELGLKNTHFMNPHGLDEDNHYSSARDMSIMAKELLKYKDILKYTSKYEDYFKKKDGSSIWLINTNKLVKFYNGMDGLKTGYTSSAGYCLTATAERNNLRFISVVMGEESIENRSEDTLKLLNYGFNTIKKEVIMKKDTLIDKRNINLSNKDKINVYLKNDVVKIYDINSSKVDFKYNIIYTNNKLPIKKNCKVGYVEITLDDGTKINEDLIVKDHIKKTSFIKLFRKNFSVITSGK
ncbi:MAG: D-alanyl-D-alanine carboxypeptidase [Bacilli bacterium]|nr:D-alanyl-D-alanine carboxypeptidase [Bacilli bacterium]